VELDGKLLADGTVRLVDDERVHDVDVRLGQAEVSRLDRVQSAGGLGS
jgi:hypothetical protein